MYDLIIFDCDGTLIDSEIIAAKVIPRIWSSYGVQINTDEFIENFVGIGHNSPKVLAVKKKLPLNIDKIIAHELEREFKKSLKAVVGMESLLRKIKQQKCIASNSSKKYIVNAVEMTGLAKYFSDKIFSAQQVENAKPAPDLFHFIANSLQVDAKRCLVLEDSPAGILGAKNAGMQVAAFTGASHFNKNLYQRLKLQNPNYLCSNTLELEQLIIK